MMIIRRRCEISTSDEKKKSKREEEEIGLLEEEKGKTEAKAKKRISCSLFSFRSITLACSIAAYLCL